MLKRPQRLKERLRARFGGPLLSAALLASTGFALNAPARPKETSLKVKKNGVSKTASEVALNRMSASSHLYFDQGARAGYLVSFNTDATDDVPIPNTRKLDAEIREFFVASVPPALEASRTQR